MQLRQKDNADKRWYSPERDITVVYPKLLRRLFYELSNEPDPALVELQIRLDAHDDDVAALAQVLGKLINCTVTREKPDKIVEALEQNNTPASVFVGHLFMRHVTAFYADNYQYTLHKGVPDPNAELVQECLDVLGAAAQRPTWWRRLWKRLTLTWAIWRWPVRRSTGDA